MNPDLLCMGCMANTNGVGVCPNCEYVNHAPAESSVQLAPRTILNGKYVLGRALGQGGFGITYLAYDLEENRKLAIKEYFPAIISTRAQDRLTLAPLSNRNRQDLEYGLNKFYEEGQALYRFRDHLNVVRMVEYFRANGTGYIVMIYIEGRTFKEHLQRKGGKIAFVEALAPLSLVMNALQDLHSAGILHRDISPDNIYLEDGGGARILDFGATRYAMGEQSRSLSVVLKPGYAPEEQYRSRGKQGPWTDIYALGATFYRAIVGEVPPESMDRLQLDDLVPPSRLGIEIPPRVEAALLKALAVKAENRFQSIAEFHEAVVPPPANAPPISAHSSKLFFLPIMAVLVLLILASANSPLMQGLFLLSQFVLFSTMLVLFFSMWKAVQDGHARISPAKAVGFTLIPIFNLYWIFPVIWGFAKEYNRFIDRHFINATKLSGPLFLLCSISLAGYWLFAALGGATTIVSLLIHSVFLFPVVWKTCNGIHALKAVVPKRIAVRVDLKRPKEAAPPIVHSLSLHCTFGEYAGQDIEIGSREIVIGRNPTLANLVLSSGEVSAKHVRVWRDRATSGVWVEDLHSSNGTFYEGSQSLENAWTRLSGSKLFAVGDRFRVSSHAAEFEIKTT
ncbi:MAG: FHA domain-containing serine/threonine-protein kinase [Terracidiphilus sp.]